MADTQPMYSTTLELPYTTAPTLPAKNNVFHDADFGTRIVRVTDSTDAENCLGMISTLNAWNYDSTRFIILHRGGTSTADYRVYTFNTSTYAVANQKSFSGSWTGSINPVTASWDMSGDPAKLYYMYGIANDTTEANRVIKQIDVTSGSGSEPAANTLVDYSSGCKYNGTISNVTSTTVFRASNLAPEETVDQFFSGLEMVAQGTSRVITNWNSATKELTIASGFPTPIALNDTFYIRYTGYQALFEASPDSNYFCWSVTEGQTTRGTGGADSGRVLFFYDRLTSTLYRHFVTAADIGEAITMSGSTGCHSIEMDKTGRYVNMSGFGTVTGQCFTWEPRTDSFTAVQEVQHRDEGYKNFVQFKRNTGNGTTDLTVRKFADVATQPVYFIWPTKGGNTSWGMDYYLTWNHNNGNYVYLTTVHVTPTSTWTSEGSNIYSKTDWVNSVNGSALPLSASTTNPQVRMNGLLLTNMGSAASNASAKALVVSANQWAYGTDNNTLYVRGPNNEDLVNNATDATVTFASGCTTTDLNTNITGGTSKVGQILIFNTQGGNNFYSQRRILTHNTGTGAMTVAALASAPSNGDTATVAKNVVHGYDVRPYWQELVKIWVDDTTNTTKTQRICHLYTHVTNGTSSDYFEQFPKPNSNRDGTFVMFTSQYDGGIRSDVFIAVIGVIPSRTTSGARTSSGARTASGTRGVRVAIL